MCHYVSQNVAWLWVKVFVSFRMFSLLVYIPLFCLIMGICALPVFLYVVKRFESPRAFYKFPSSSSSSRMVAARLSLVVTASF